MKCKAALLSFFTVAILALPATGFSSPWSEEEGYGNQVAGKFKFGLKNALLGWTSVWTETNKYENYIEGKTGWEGFCVGLSKFVLNTANGVVHLATFPIPVDFPDLGDGVLHKSVEEEAAEWNLKYEKETDEVLPSDMLTVDPFAKFLTGAVKAPLQIVGKGADVVGHGLQSGANTVGKGLEKSWDVVESGAEKTASVFS